MPNHAASVPAGYWRCALWVMPIICLPLFSVAYADDASLSREEILRQHQQLEHEHQSSGLSDDNHDDSNALAPPMAPIAGDSVGTANSLLHVQGSRQTGQVHSGNDDLATRLLERVSALESQVRQMRGDLDILTNKVQQDEASMNKQFGDLQFALQNQPGSKKHLTGSDATEKAVKTKAEIPQTDSGALQQGQAALKAHRYAEAEVLARHAVVMAHSVSGKQEAHYLLANALAGQKRYRQSAVTYYDIYSKAPKSAFAPDALLGVASSMLGMGDKSNACEALVKLTKEYPMSSVHIKRSVKVLRERAACH